MTRPEFTLDIHAHISVPEVFDLIRGEFDPARDPFLRFGGISTAYNDALAEQLLPLLVDPARRLERMDSQRVRCQAVSIAPPQYHYWAGPELGAEIARIQNDRIAEVVSRTPDRLIGLATLPMQAPIRAIAELERVTSRYGFPGITINPSAGGADYDEPAYEPFWQRVNELDVAVILHPNGFSDGQRLTRHYLINVVGNPLETTVALSRLILSGVLERHPGLKIVAVHGGGYLPFYMDRMDHAYAARADVSAQIPRKPSTYLRRLFFDSVVFGQGLQRLVDLVGSDHIVMGSDYPYDMGELDPVGRIESLTGVSPDERRGMLGRNAAQLLGLSVHR